MKSILAATALVLATLSTAAIAQTAKPEDGKGSLTDKAMKDQPGASGGGSTTNPTAKPEDGKGSLTDKAMKDQPGAAGGGSTTNPTAQPKSGSLTDKETPVTK